MCPTETNRQRFLAGLFLTANRTTLCDQTFATLDKDLRKGGDIYVGIWLQRMQPDGYSSLLAAYIVFGMWQGRKTWLAGNGKA